ncbi:MAG: TraR/DksA C4-type zinc finger protein [Chloroflexus sp.]
MIDHMIDTTATQGLVAAEPLASFLRQSAAMHRHLCPRQVLGARMGMYAGELLGLKLPQTTTKRLYVFVETDGCFADGVSVATGCWLGRRTMRLIDEGKVAATFVDTQTGQAWRITLRSDVRELARHYAPDARSRWHAYLIAYQQMPLTDLLVATPVVLTIDLKALISRNGLRTLCTSCGEEIINAREVMREGQLFCRSCAGERYYLKKTAEWPEQ